MKDLTIALDNRPGALAEMGDALGRAGVSIEGGGRSLSTVRLWHTFSSRMERPLAWRSKRRASQFWKSGTCQ
jgi:hypothetical protein